jgi:hypothetical protein
MMRSKPAAYDIVLVNINMPIMNGGFLSRKRKRRDRAGYSGDGATAWAGREKQTQFHETEKSRIRRETRGKKREKGMKKGGMAMRGLNILSCSAPSGQLDSYYYLNLVLCVKLKRPRHGAMHLTTATPTPTASLRVTKCGKTRSREEQAKSNVLLTQSSG